MAVVWLTDSAAGEMVQTCKDIVQRKPVYFITCLKALKVLLTEMIF